MLAPQLRSQKRLMPAPPAPQPGSQKRPREATPSVHAAFRAFAGLRLCPTSYHKNEALQRKFFSIPEVAVLHEYLAQNAYDYFLVGGAIRDFICGCTDVKDIDCHVCGLTQRELIDFAKEYLDEFQKIEIKKQPFRVAVGKAGGIDEIDLIPFELYLYDRNFAENDVNSLAFHLESATVVDVFGSGYANAHRKRFRIPADSLESWYNDWNPGPKQMYPRGYKGKVLRLFKMLAKGFEFQTHDQKDAFVQLCLDKAEDLTADTISGFPNRSFSIVEEVLGFTVRGDTLIFDGPEKGQVAVGTDPQKVAKYEACLDNAEKLDSRLVLFRKHMANQREKREPVQRLSLPLSERHARLLEWLDGVSTL